MKQLIIGIDGGTLDIFERMPMPFLHEKIKQYTGPKLEIDLLSRGWAEQLTGTYAHTNKGFYVFPKLDGTREFLFKYSLQDMLSHPDVSPIWNVVLDSGSSVGIMNIPTTFPAPEVNGFFVSGAGGGLNEVVGVPEAMCQPIGVNRELEGLDYVVDIRLGTASLKTVEEVFDEVENMAERRVEAYITLCRKYSPDFGFLAFRNATVIEYLGMSEIMAFIGEEEFPVSAVWQERLEAFFSHFDSLLEKLFNELKPERYLLTSDHGLGPTREYCNPNAFLQMNGFQKLKVQLGPSVRRVGGALRRLNKPSLSKIVDWSNSVAFSDWYSSCIYVNDRYRFKGPVETAQIDEVVDQICDVFNKDSEVCSREMKAVPYRRNYQGARYYDQMADIAIIHKQSIFVSSTSGPFFSKNPNYAPVPDMSAKPGGMHSGNKTRFPFFATDPETAKLIRPEDPKDLTLVYKLTERIFGEA
jgi:predicted AlkP superfamily phosphohydrolase/phosphomutase